ncbi:LysR family transcriptional regulator [Arthrobacter sp. UC242_113]|uniref:LysR family transcriptional regulator n=1 Tax=Arthrobacter sp. UC242_113 TaxID=3374550 RepID=UPI003757B29F
MELDQLRALAAVVDHETFDAAASELRLTPSAVSQRIKALERSVGSVLVRRLKPVRPTPAGEQLLRSARQLLLLADEAVLALRGREPTESADGGRPSAERLRVPIVANADSIATWLPAAYRAIALGGRVALELLRDDEHATADLLRSGDAVGAITADPRPVQGCTIRPLGTMVYPGQGVARVRGPLVPRRPHPGSPRRGPRHAVRPEGHAPAGGPSARGPGSHSPTALHSRFSPVRRIDSRRPRLGHGAGPAGSRALAR